MPDALKKYHQTAEGLDQHWRSRSLQEQRQKGGSRIQPSAEKYTMIPVGRLVYMYPAFLLLSPFISVQLSNLLHFCFPHSNYLFI